MPNEPKFTPERPLQRGDSEALGMLCKEADRLLPDHTGYIIVATPFGDKIRPLRYASNIDRADAIKLLKDFLFHIGEGENWMKHIK